MCVGNNSDAPKGFFMRRLLALCLFGLVLSFSVNATMHVVTPDTLSNWVSKGTSFDFLLIDVRDSSEMDTIIATETCRPYHLSYNQGIFQSTVSKLPKAVSIMLYCEHGGRSAAAAQMLDTSGFSSVYYMQGGFLSWAGPTGPYSYLKPTSALPAPSMLATAVNEIFSQKSGAGNPRLMSLANRSIVSSGLLTKQHSFTVFNLAGRCMLQSESPFSKATSFTIPGGVPPGMYVVELKEKGVSAVSMKVEITK
jgi:rhodanese-related sulfurtransferase